ncbi:hypothetical protein [Arthrobacter oryzae]|uniref:Uncharacterized protein n=1 Tax=Arthrobacter oryzae TaxID=409290 RepID=A0A3N0C4V7_9MICC|nr:hypothetical protein [Arthrobacter oryzae]RNL57912.1 hypothetical protein D7003_05030 [Arthrobacter oryzae]
MTITMKGYRVQRPAERLDGFRTVLTGLSLADNDLDGGVVLARISSLQAEINDLTLVLAGSEAWLIEWLAIEHSKGSVLYAAAKISKSRNEPLDKSPSDARSRSAIMDRFNDWASTFLTRLDDYEASSRQPATVAPWIAGAEAFPGDHQP